MDYDEGHRAAQMMEKMGGGFASAIAHAYYKADSSNAMRLRLAFYEMFEQHYEMYERELKAQASRNPVPCY